MGGSELGCALVRSDLLDYLRHGVVTLDEITLSSPKLGNYFLSWGQRTAQGHTFGRLQISKDRLWLSGAIGSSIGSGAPAVFCVIGVAEPQRATLSDGRSLTFQYQPDQNHPGRVVPSVQVGDTRLSGELNTQLGADGSLQLEHPDLPSKVALVPRTDGAAPAKPAAAAHSLVGAVSPSLLTPQNLAQQNIEDIEADSQAAFLQNLSWALEPAWSQAFLPQSTDISTDANRAGLVDQDAEWYNATYAPAFLGYGLSNNELTNSKAKLSQQNINRLSYFLYEDLACDPSYIRQSNVATIPAAIAATQNASPNLGDYLNDASTLWSASPPSSWLPCRTISTWVSGIAPPRFSPRSCRTESSLTLRRQPNSL
jgi:hypothetical protein